MLIIRRKYLYRILNKCGDDEPRDVTEQVAGRVLLGENQNGLRVVGFSGEREARAVLAHYIAGGYAPSGKVRGVRSLVDGAEAIMRVYPNGVEVMGSTRYYIDIARSYTLLGDDCSEKKVVCTPAGLVSASQVDFDYTDPII